MPVSYAIERVGSLKYIDDRLWGEVADPRDMYQSYSWLRALEKSDDAAVTYLLARQRGRSRILGALPIFDCPTTRGDYLYWPELHFQDLMRGSALLGDRLGLLAGSSAGFSTKLVLDRAVFDTARVQVLRSLLDAACAVAADRGIAYVFFLFLEDSARRDLAAAIGGDVHFRLAGAAQTELELPGEKFDDYLATLGKNVRTSVRRETALFLESCSTEVVPLGEAIPCIAPLVAQVRAKHGLAYSVDVVARRHRVYHAALGDDLAKALLCLRNGRIVGASVLCQWNDQLYVTDFGRAESRAGSRTGSRVEGRIESDTPDPFVYFNATIYEPIRYAYSMGLSRVVTGAGSELGKARRGSSLQPLTHLAIAAGERTKYAVDTALDKKLVEHWRNERSAHPKYFGSVWDELM